MDTLPDEIVENIISHLALHKRKLCELVNCNWYLLCNNLLRRATHISISNVADMQWITTRLSSDSFCGKSSLKSVEFQSKGGSIPQYTFQQFALTVENLTALSLVSVKLTNSFLQIVAVSLPQLRHFNAEYFTGSHVQYSVYPNHPDLDSGLGFLLHHCTNLERFSVYIDRIPEPRKLSHLAKLKNLQHLSLRTRLYRSECFEDLFRLISSFANRLKTLEVVMCFDQHVTDWWGTAELMDFMREIGFKAQALEKVRLDFAEHYRRADFPLWRFASALKYFPLTLRDISLQGCEGIETVDLASIAENCHNLSRLNLSDVKIGCEMSLGVLQRCENLSVLDISRVVFYDRKSMVYRKLNDPAFSLVLLIQNLEFLVADGLSDISSEFLLDALVPYIAKSPSLLGVSLKHNANVTHEFLWSIYHNLCARDTSETVSVFKIAVDLEYCRISATSPSGLGLTPVLVNFAHGVSSSPMKGLWYPACNGEIFIARSLR